MWGSFSPSSFDCSGFTYVYKNLEYIWPLYRVTIFSRKPVNKSELVPGDLVFFNTTVTFHVGIYTGGGQFIHASSEVEKLQ